jgi:hypothetical protein
MVLSLLAKDFFQRMRVAEPIFQTNERVSVVPKPRFAITSTRQLFIRTYEYVPASKENPTTEQIPATHPKNHPTTIPNKTPRITEQKKTGRMAFARNC